MVSSNDTIECAVAVVLVCALLIATPAWSQAPPSPSAPPTAPLAIPSPNYTTMTLEITVNRPAAETWARIGRFCDLREWLGRDCTITSGKDGELGAVRTLAGGVIEPIVAVTPMSYTYTFPVRVGVPYTMQHNTLEARVVDANTSRIVYSFFWDNSMLTTAQREAEVAARKERLTPAMERMKTLVESGKPRPSF
jgi:Polyketide cyclase / dehydrase and lipid transport